MDTTQSLPCEVWTMIAAYVDRPDLRALMCVSPFLCNIARIALVRCVHLIGEPGPMTAPSVSKQIHTETLKQLEDQNLFRFIRRLSIDWTKATEALYIPSLRSMYNLKHLKLHAVPRYDHICGEGTLWSSGDAQFGFVNDLNHLGIESLDFAGCGDTFMVDDFPLANLKSLTWSQENEITGAFLSTCKASGLTLSHISLTVNSHVDYASDYEEFFACKFPALKLLKIGPGNSAVWQGIDHIVGDAFMDFLAEHPTIETLDLPWDTDFDEETKEFVGIASLSLFFRGDTDILPRLHTLKACAENLELCASYEMPFLKTLTKMSILAPIYDWEGLGGSETADVNRLLSALENYKTLYGTLALRTWIMQLSVRDLEYRKVTDRETFVGWFNAAAKVFTELETYIGDIYNMSVLLETFPGFKRLRNISCPTRELKLEDVQTLAERIPTLETVRCFKSGLTYSIIRGSNGSVDVREMYIIIPHDEIEDEQYLDEDDGDETSEETDDEKWLEEWNYDRDYYDAHVDDPEWWE